jgi:Terminase large subunit, T4likevirus-type, N-terminal
MPAKPAPQILAPPEKIAQLAALRERLREQEAEQLRHVDVFGLLDYEPTPKQRLFHEATEHSVLFGGSTGGGKSRALTAEAIRACVRYPGLRVGAFRRSYPELRESLLAELAKLQYAAPLGARWNGTEHELRFANGSVIMFRYAETLADATRRQGGEYQLVCFDELTLFPPDVVTFLESRVRSGRADIPVLGVRASANPGGPGHGAVKDRYIKPTRYGADVVLDERGRTVRFVPSRLSDNPHMNAEHASDLLALSGQMREAFLEGNWDVFAGQMYPELKRDRHVVEPFALPAGWTRFCGVDWGYFPGYWAVVWASLDEDGRVWVYREAYEQRVGEAEQAKRILAAEAPREHVAVRYGDDAMFATRGDAKPISEVYSENGVHLTPASKGSRVTGWQRVRSYLAEIPACPHHRAQGWEMCPRLHIFSGCENLFRHLADLTHATKGDPEDAGPNPHDHLPDALRYLLINLGTGPVFVLPDAPASSLGDGVEHLEPMGAFARRPDDGPERDPFGEDDDDGPPRGMTQRAPWA